MTHAFTEDLPTLVDLASKALLNQQYVTLLLPPDWERPRGFPLPVKADRSCNIRNYRPIAIMEWVHAKLLGQQHDSEVDDCQNLTPPQETQ